MSDSGNVDVGDSGLESTTGFSGHRAHRVKAGVSDS